MIKYIECRNANRVLCGIIDDFNSLIWHTEYFGTGDFEIITNFNRKHADLLKIGCFITRPDSVQCGVIERVSIKYNPEEGRTLTVSGRFCLSLLERRIVFNPLTNYHTKPTTIYDGTKTEMAARQLLTDHMISPLWTRRQISFMKLGLFKNLGAVSSERQSTYQNLLSFTQKILQNGKENGKIMPYGAFVSLSRKDSMLYYNVYNGQDRSSGKSNVTFGITPLIFSEDFDNLSSFEYTKDYTDYKNDAVVGGEGEGKERFYQYCYPDYDPKRDRVNRWELFIDESSISKTYTNSSGQEATYSDTAYAKLLENAGRAALKEYSPETIITGDIDVTNTGLKFAPTPLDSGDYCVGDIVLLKDNAIGISVSSRITAVTEVQDLEGYSVTASFDDEPEEAED